MRNPQTNITVVCLHIVSPCNGWFLSQRRRSTDCGSVRPEGAILKARSLDTTVMAYGFCTSPFFRPYLPISKTAQSKIAGSLLSLPTSMTVVSDHIQLPEILKIKHSLNIVRDGRAPKKDLNPTAAKEMPPSL